MKFTFHLELVNQIKQNLGVYNMFLIPSPKQLELKKGTLQLKRDTEIVLDYQCSFDDLNAAILLQEEIQQELGFKLLINKVFAALVIKLQLVLKKPQAPK